MAADGGGPLPEWPEQSPPIQLVAFDTRAPAHGGPQLVVREEARDALMKATGSRPVRAVAVCGVYRTGKSFLLNLLSGTQGEGRFAVGDSVRACTSGLWVRASKPAAQDGSVCLLVDCEGSGNTERDREHDARLFALAVLISSLLIFNSRGVISDTAVQALALAASLAQHIHRQHKGLAPGVRLSPGFLWVLRDFALALEDTSGNPITAQEYMEQILTRFSTAAGRPPPGADVANWDEKREAREKIMELFPERDCVTLVRPVDDEENLQRLGELSLAELRPKFAAQVKEFRSKVFSSCQLLQSPKGDPATGGAFLALLDAHVEAMNAGTVPDLGDTWQHILQQECGRAIEAGLREFSAATFEVAPSLPMPEEELQEVLDRAQAVARQKFAEIAMGDKEARAEYEAELEQALTETSTRLRKENGGRAERENELWLQNRWESCIEEPLRQYRLRYDSDGLSMEECEEAEAMLKTQFAELDQAYSRESVGPVDACQGPYERTILRRQEAALREVEAWRRHAEKAAEAQAAAREAAEEERARHEEAGEELARKARREVDDSKARMQAREKAAKNGKAGGKRSPAEGKQPKCCTVQ